MSMTEEEVEPFLTSWRRAIVEKIVDADTFDLLVDIGFEVRISTRFRLEGVDAWEVRGSERELGKIASARVKELMPIGSEVRILSFKGGSKGKYGRWIARVAYKAMESNEWLLLGETLLAEGHGEEYTK